MPTSNETMRWPALSPPANAAQWGVVAALRPLHILLASPVALYLVTLTIMLFRPPDLHFFEIDRIAFVLLAFVVFLRALMLRQSGRPSGLVIWPMLALTVVAVGGAIGQQFQAEAWSVLAAKWIVPLAMYGMASLVFTGEASLRALEAFLLAVLAYLSIIAILFLCGMKSWIVPSFIIDPSIGIHADRARGPFLQAVANGVTLNLLWLIAVDAYRRGRLRGVLAWFFLPAPPLAILATKTRAVWLSFVVCVLALLWLSSSPRVRRACLGLVLAGVVGWLSALTFDSVNNSLTDRLKERSPIEFRMAVYRAGWDMFYEKPLLGWGAAQSQAGLERRISEFHQEEFFVHNTFLEIAVDYGLVGLALYVWLVVDLFLLGRKRARLDLSSSCAFLNLEFRSLWPVLLGVYLLNACFVVMNYQFVNGVLFTLAGILAAQQSSSEDQRA